MLRVAADFDNYRKRSARELEDARRRGQQSTVRELLAVFDNLERATQQVTETTDPKTVAQGVRMVLKLFVDTLARLGIERIESLGKAFDPGLHDGMQHIHSDEHPAGAVAQELQPGYRMGRELIRPALVVVSKGPEPAEDPAEEPAQEPAHEPAQEPAPETADDATETVESEAPEEGTGSDPSA
jgi:molecular chaperone GrpE